MAQDDWRSAIEIHPPGWKCPATPFWIAGWIMAPSGRTPVDVRAWLGPKVFLGLCGLPRTEIEKEHTGQSGPPYAGFCFLFQPVAGATELRLEACDAAGRWTEFFRQSVEIAGGASAVVAPVTAVTQTLLRLLAAHRAHPSHAWSTLAGDVLAAEYATPLNSLPNPPFYGALEQPEAAAFDRYGRIAVTGWLAHRERRIVKLTAFVDSATPVTLLHGLPRPDVSGIFAELVEAKSSRFAGYCESPSGLPLPACLRLFAELDDGRIELVFAQRFRPEATTGSDSGLPPLSLYTFWRAFWALRSAAKRLGWSLGNPEQVRKARRLAWETYRRDAMATSTLGPRHDDPAPTPARPLRVTVVTHNLNREGAPLIAFEYACHLAQQPGWQVRIVSPQDGPLREDFVGAGLTVELADIQPLFAASTPAEFDRLIGELAAGPGWTECDLIVANTMVAFWAVHLARRLGKPSLFSIHESASVRHFFVPFNMPPIVPRIEEAFGLATRTVFSAAATGAVHARLERRDNFRVLPGWVEVEGILAYREAHTPVDLRRAHDLPADAVIFANIGSVSERKGQHVFVAAIDLLLRARAGRSTVTPPLAFLMVGAFPSFYLDLVRHDLVRRGLAGVRIIERVADARPYFQLSDIFVCTSFEEALPRVVMEAAAFGRSIVSTAVNGIPEILGPEDAWLTPAGDAAALATALDAALDAHLSGDRSRAERAHRQVCANFSAATLLPRHARLASATADLPVV